MIKKKKIVKNKYNKKKRIIRNKTNDLKVVFEKVQTYI